jgi:hypothetical protein
VLKTVCRKLQEDSGTGGFFPRISLFMVGKTHKSHGARSELYGGCSNGVPPISVSAHIAAFQSRKVDTPIKLLGHPKKGYFKTIVTQTLTTVRRVKTKPLLRYPHHYNLA